MATTEKVITADQARALLNEIDGVSFTDEASQAKIEHVLTELAFWSKSQHDEEVAIAWIRRLYDVRPCRDDTYVS
jgi:predicted oxidoreductase